MAWMRRLQRLDPPRREGARDEPAEPGVIGRVDGEHVPGERRPGKALGHDGRIGGQGGVHVLRESGVVERGKGSVVTNDEPGIVAVDKRDRVHRAEIAHLGEQRKGIIAMVQAPGTERLSHIRIDHPIIFAPTPPGSPRCVRARAAIRRNACRARDSGRGRAAAWRRA